MAVYDSQRLPRRDRYKFHDFVVRIQVTGSIRVGKSTLVRHFITGNFEDVPQITGVRVENKRFEFGNLAGVARIHDCDAPYHLLTAKHDDAVMITYNIYDRYSFHVVEKIVNEIRTLNNEAIMILVATTHHEVGRDGTIVMDFNTRGMPRAAADSSGLSEVRLGK